MSSDVPSILPEESSVQEDFSKEKFDLTPDTKIGKLVVTCHGNKGDGKTTAIFLVTTGRIGALGNGKTVAISFDNKTKVIKDQFFQNDNIIVHDGKRYFRTDPRIITKSGMQTYNYLQKLIESFEKLSPDWIVFDGFTILALILEMAMRYQHNLRPTQGIANYNIWKDRGGMIQDLHNMSIRIAKKGVVYITYSDKDEIVQDGQLVSKEDIPKYIDIVMQETDVVLRAQKAKGKTGDTFFLRVESTKYKQYIGSDGKPIPITDQTLSQGRIINITEFSNKPAITIEQKDKIPEKVPTEEKKEEIVPKQEEVVKEKEVPKIIEEKAVSKEFVIPDVMNL